VGKKEKECEKRAYAAPSAETRKEVISDEKEVSLKKEKWELVRVVNKDLSKLG